MTNTEQRALEILQTPQTCTGLGEILWGLNNGGNLKRHVNRQSYARPAGKIIKRLASQGLVARMGKTAPDYKHSYWQATTMSRA